MRITVFGASGRVGRQFVELALKDGVEVIAFIHSKPLDIENMDLTFFSGDICSLDDVMKASSGSDIIISALGSWGKSSKNVMSIGVGNMIKAMQKNHINRIITLTGADAKASGDKTYALNRVSRFIFGLVAKDILEDGEKHIRLLEKTDLDWTVLRSPAMNNLGNPNRYKFSLDNSYPLRSINRRSVALALLNLTRNQDYKQKAPYIVRGN